MTAFTRTQPEVVIEQLTFLPKTYTSESMSAASALNTRIRREGGANVLAAAQAAGVRRYLSFYFGHSFTALVAGSCSFQ
ncbi:MAG: hypothetical protein V7K69_30010 [Nostoc sp.]|uniref:hypothetical protein n=1 Tax=Nostoc sp. TaxID=1180 RepID=UPI002FF4E8A9